MDSSQYSEKILRILWSKEAIEDKNKKNYVKTPVFLR